KTVPARFWRFGMPAKEARRWKAGMALASGVTRKRNTGTLATAEGRRATGPRLHQAKRPQRGHATPGRKTIAAAAGPVGHGCPDSEVRIISRRLPLRTSESAARSGFLTPTTRTGVGLPGTSPR